MDEYPSITAAARRRDWDGCARIMFRQLFFCTPEQQNTITLDALLAYAETWNEKHPGQNVIPLLTDRKQHPNGIFSFHHELDPADAEFENAVIEYRAGISPKLGQVQRVSHFATAIRSAVLATQINRWIVDFPDEYRSWQSGLATTGPTFLDDAVAADDAERAWTRIDSSFSRLLGPGGQKGRPEISTSDIEGAYDAWERSIA